MYGGGHLLKKAFKWARNNPDTIGRGINTVTKFLPQKYQGIGNAIRKTAMFARSVAPKNSYVNRLANATLKSNEQRGSSTPAVTYDSSPASSARGFTSKKRYL